MQWYYEPFTQRCEAFYYRGCGGTPNRYSSRSECLRSCGCFSEIDSGYYPCPLRSTTRWVFNKYTGACDRIRFSGCNGGNDNNFRSHLECESTCGPHSNRGPFGPPFFGMGAANMARGAAAAGRGNIAQNMAASGGQQSKRWKSNKAVIYILYTVFFYFKSSWWHCILQKFSSARYYCPSTMNAPDHLKALILVLTSFKDVQQAAKGYLF